LFILSTVGGFLSSIRNHGVTFERIIRFIKNKGFVISHSKEEEKSMSELDKIFDSVGSRSLFKDKVTLQANYSPENIPHRDEQIEYVASILAPALLGEKTSNLFIYGKTGTGKTLSVQHVANELTKRASENKVLRVEYLNCKLKKVADTEYRILAELIKKLGGSVPATGLPTDQVYLKFLDILEKSEEKLLILILDEIDQAVKKINDEFLYNLTRLNSELNNTQIILVGISNDLRFLDMIDQRVRSSLSEEELVFPPYNAMQLQDILRKRSDDAFKDKVVDDGVIAKCAAYAAREHGDARRALDLLRVAGELAERSSHEKIKIDHIDGANDKIEKDKILDIIETGTKQFQLILYAIMELVEKNKVENKGKKKEGSVYTGDIFDYYESLCKNYKVDCLTQRRVSDIIAELDMLGLINARVISKGRHGRMREIHLAIPDNIIERAKLILAEGLGV
jgi:archaeal cell division control protein 6